MAATLTVTFVPLGAAVTVPEGTSVLEAARRAGVPLPATCGGQGTCGDCAVRVLAGEVPPPSVTEAAALASAPPDVRLACMLRPLGDVTVRPVAPIPQPVPARPSSAGTGRTAVAAAVDLGTTTITASLLGASGESTGSGSVANPQRTFGGDVASRIAAAAFAGDARALQDLAVLGVSEALTSGGGTQGVTRVVVACNTAMAHLALGAEVSGLTAHPYAGALSGISRTTAGRLGLVPLPAGAEIVFLPPMAAFVGGDATAGALATGLDRSSGVRVLVDLGTNAEVVVSVEGELTVASAAAGPAFEAAGLSSGGPAVRGAVRDTRIEDGDLLLQVVDGGEARSICGSGALSLVGALLAAGHLDGGGRLSEDGPLRPRFHRRGDVLALQVAGVPGGRQDVYLTQLDVRELQLAKAAVATALQLTLRRAKVEWADVDEVIVAGAFGAGIDVGVLHRIGILPARTAVPVTNAGDAALAGAELVARDARLEARAEELARKSRGVDLAAEPDFQRAFVAHTALRRTD